MVNIYLVRHGKTMFNTIGRAQGWSDTPLTREGEAGIIELGRGLEKEKVQFDRAYSSDSGRAIETLNIILKYQENKEIPCKTDKRIREWNFGSFDGGYDGDLFDGVLPRVFAERGENERTHSYKEIAEAIYQIDTAGWAETWDELSHRIMTGFHDIASEAEECAAARIVIVSHSMTISTFLKILEPKSSYPTNLDNGSVTHLSFHDGDFKIGKVGDTHYREIGHSLEIEEEK